MITPAPEHFLVEPIDPSDEVSEGGLQRIEKTDSPPIKGMLVAMHLTSDSPFRDANLFATPKSKTTVWFEEHAGTEVEHDGKKYLLVKEREIIAYENK